MITFDDDNITFVFQSGESRNYRRTDSTRSAEPDLAIESMRASAWLRCTDDAMFANYFEPCIDR